MKGLDNKRTFILEQIQEMLGLYKQLNNLTKGRVSAPVWMSEFL